MASTSGTTDAGVWANQWARVLSRKRVVNAITVVALLIGSAFVLLPLFWIVDTAFKPIGDAFVLPPKFVYAPTLGNFQSLIGGQYNQYLDDMGHSAIIMGVSVAIAIGL